MVAFFCFYFEITTHMLIYSYLLAPKAARSAYTYYYKEQRQLLSSLPENRNFTFIFFFQ
jgi:hypothetical protein